MERPAKKSRGEVDFSGSGNSGFFSVCRTLASGKWIGDTEIRNLFVTCRDTGEVDIGRRDVGVLFAYFAIRPHLVSVRRDRVMQAVKLGASASFDNYLFIQLCKMDDWCTPEGVPRLMEGVVATLEACFESPSVFIERSRQRVDGTGFCDRFRIYGDRGFAGLAADILGVAIGHTVSMPILYRSNPHVLARQVSAVSFSKVHWVSKFFSVKNRALMERVALATKTFLAAETGIGPSFAFFGMFSTTPSDDLPRGCLAEMLSYCKGSLVSRIVCNLFAKAGQPAASFSWWYYEGRPVPVDHPSRLETATFLPLEAESGKDVVLAAVMNHCSRLRDADRSFNVHGALPVLQSEFGVLVDLLAGLAAFNLFSVASQLVRGYHEQSPDVKVAMAEAVAAKCNPTKAQLTRMWTDVVCGSVLLFRPGEVQTLARLFPLDLWAKYPDHPHVTKSEFSVGEMLSFRIQNIWDPFLLDFFEVAVEEQRHLEAAKCATVDIDALMERIRVQKQKYHKCSPTVPCEWNK